MDEDQDEIFQGDEGELSDEDAVLEEDGVPEAILELDDGDWEVADEDGDEFEDFVDDMDDDDEDEEEDEDEEVDLEESDDEDEDDGASLAELYNLGANLYEYTGRLPSEDPALEAADGRFLRSPEPTAYPIKTLKYHQQVADAIVCQSSTAGCLPYSEMVVLYRSSNDNHKRIMLLKIGGDDVLADAEAANARRRRESGLAVLPEAQPGAGGDRPRGPQACSPAEEAHASEAGAGGGEGGGDDAQEEGPAMHAPDAGIQELEQAKGQGYEPLAEGLLPLYPYSLARSSCGRYIAVCGSYGLFTIFQAKPLQSPPVSNGLSRMPQLVTGIITCKEDHPGNPHWLMQDNMNNSVRFGHMFGRERIIIACQVGQLGFMEANISTKKKTFAYIMNIPDPSVEGHTLAEQLSCIPPYSSSCEGRDTDGQACPPGAVCKSAKGDTVVRLEVKQMAVVRAMDVQMLRSNMAVKTSALGPFPMDLNCAVPSPDGKWVAAVADSLEMYLVRFGEGERAWQVEECITVPMSHDGDPYQVNMQTGSQYVAWNRDSSMVAATTDLSGRVFVYSVLDRRLVGGSHTRSHGRPCMALSWSPFNSRVLAYAQDAFHVLMTDVVQSTLEQPWQGCQVLTVPKPKPGERRQRFHQHGRVRRSEIHGLAWGGNEIFPALFVATAEKMLMWKLHSLEPWSPDKHSVYPKAFQRAARVVLQGSLLDASTGQARCAASDDQVALGLWSLPKEVLLHILSMCAEAPEEWLASCLQSLPATASI